MGTSIDPALHDDGMGDKPKSDRGLIPVGSGLVGFMESPLQPSCIASAVSIGTLHPFKGLLAFWEGDSGSNPSSPALLILENILAVSTYEVGLCRPIEQDWDFAITMYPAHRRMQAWATSAALVCIRRA